MPLTSANLFARAARCRPEREQRFRSGNEDLPIRILHVVSRMDRAGIETWLMHVLRHIDSSRFQMDFLVHTDEPCLYDHEILSLGGHLLRAVPLREVWKYERMVDNALRSVPPYDIVHSHLDYFSGYALKCAHRAGIPVRITHSHLDLGRSFRCLKWQLKVYARRSRSLMFRHATHGLACSKIAGEWLFDRSRSSLPWNVLHYGIDLSPLQPATTRPDIRREFGIPENVMVIGHVGRFCPQKNHEMIVNIADALRRRKVPFHLVFVGDGPLRQNIEAEIRARRISNHVVFAGVRADVPRLFTSLFDVFVFPSLFEGLPLVLLEALAAGCPAVISDAISSEADVVPSLVKRLPLSAAHEQWARAVHESARQRLSREQHQVAFNAMRDSGFNISNCVRNLTDLYTREVARRTAA